jgi:hypothetical protein
MNTSTRQLQPTNDIHDPNNTVSKIINKTKDLKSEKDKIFTPEKDLMAYDDEEDYMNSRNFHLLSQTQDYSYTSPNEKFSTSESSSSMIAFSSLSDAQFVAYVDMLRGRNRY